ncbi:unnamed protein product [Effrenium voratum]|uniref:CSD domain-containing protein n=1 Tax=Effrenium voratum TaxID=2562239 RepID=A0AA36HQN0_9DINO|nr:unnamed protein product [Effrenium voratum]CAJ1435120.1 unnamed protein product [Effrenium voratum]
MPSTGTVKSFNPVKGWGFIDCCGVDVFVHVKYCVSGQPAVGDVVTFDIEKNPKCPEQPQAKNVKGCSGQRADELNKQLIANMLGMTASEPPPEQPKGAFHGVVRAYNPDKGFGFIEPAIYRQPVLLRAADMAIGEPKVGDTVYFDVEPVKLDDGTVQLKAINVSSGTCQPEKSEDSYGPVDDKTSKRPGPMDGQGKKSLARIRGMVHSWIPERGWGFATIPGCTDIFVHSHHCVGGFTPQPGDVLEFELERGKKKDGTINFTAINVTLATPHTPAMGPKPPKNSVPVGVKRLMAKLASKAAPE